MNVITDWFVQRFCICIAHYSCGKDVIKQQGEKLFVLILDAAFWFQKIPIYSSWAGVSKSAQNHVHAKSQQNLSIKRKAEILNSQEKL